MTPPIGEPGAFGPAKSLASFGEPGAATVSESANHFGVSELTIPMP